METFKCNLKIEHWRKKFILNAGIVSVFVLSCIMLCGSIVQNVEYIHKQIQAYLKYLNCRTYLIYIQHMTTTCILNIILSEKTSFVTLYDLLSSKYKLSVLYRYEEE